MKASLPRIYSVIPPAIKLDTILDRTESLIPRCRSARAASAFGPRARAVSCDGPGRSVRLPLPFIMAGQGFGRADACQFCRQRAPEAAKIALPIAGATAVVAGSPNASASQSHALGAIDPIEVGTNLWPSQLSAGELYRSALRLVRWALLWNKEIVLETDGHQGGGHRSAVVSRRPKRSRFPATESYPKRNL